VAVHPRRSDVRGLFYRLVLLATFLSILAVIQPSLAQKAALVKDINTTTDTGSSDPAGFVQIGSRTFFSASDPNFGRELWVTDGTTPGTVQVKDICPGDCSSNPLNLIDVNGTLFFSADDPSGVALWKSDGTAAGTVLIKAPCPVSSGLSCAALDFTTVNGVLFFTIRLNGVHVQLWKSDGSPNGTAMILDNVGFAQTSGPPEFDLTNLNGTLFFISADANSNHALWKSDGTTGGTVMVKGGFPSVCSIATNICTPGFSRLTGVNGKLFFAGNDGVHGVTLWTSDGTASGTVMLCSNCSFPSGMIGFQAATFFFATDAASFGLWKSDGTGGGTVLVRIFCSSCTSSSFTDVAVINANGALFFGFGLEGLWKSDGTANGTVMLSGTASFHNLTNANGTVFSSDEFLEKSDGTSAGTVCVCDATNGNGVIAHHLFSASGKLLFSGQIEKRQPAPTLELLTSDGTFNGTTMVKNIGLDISSFPQFLTTSNGTLFFAATDGTTEGIQLWKSDGTLNGTVMVQSGFTKISDLTDVNGTLFFKDKLSSSSELWKSQGTSTSTVRLLESNF